MGPTRFFLPSVSNWNFRLRPMIPLHELDWTPAWIRKPGPFSASDSGPQGACKVCEGAAAAVATRVVREPPGVSPIHAKVTKIALDAIYECSTHSGPGLCFPHNPQSYTRCFELMTERLYDFECSEPAPPGEKERAVGIVKAIVLKYGQAFWEPEEVGENTTEMNVELFCELDIVVRKTYGVKSETDAAWRRHVVLNLLSVFLELSPVNAYGIICNYSFGV
jgi:hypothetical protein